MPERVLVLIPVFNDWSSAAILIPELDRVLHDSGVSAEVILVDDCSSEPVNDELRVSTKHIRAVDVLRLRRNVGHQRAIAIGLAYVDAYRECDLAVVMDGDGEDRPDDVRRLIDELRSRNGRTVVFAERTRRSEGFAFVLMYSLYRFVHLLLTGERVRVGNFSAIPRSAIKQLTASSDLWNHYAAAIFKSRIPYCTITTTRGSRYAGHGHMNYVALVTHGLSAMSVFGERIGVRLIGATLGLATLLLLAWVSVLVWQISSHVTVPGWAGYAWGLVVVIFFQALAAALSFAFLILSGRDSSTFLPLRDYSYFIDSIAPLTGSPARA